MSGNIFLTAVMYSSGADLYLTHNGLSLSLIAVITATFGNFSRSDRFSICSEKTNEKISEKLSFSQFDQMSSPYFYSNQLNLSFSSMSTGAFLSMNQCHCLEV